MMMEEREFFFFFEQFHVIKFKPIILLPCLACFLIQWEHKTTQKLSDIDKTHLTAHQSKKHNFPIVRLNIIMLHFLSQNCFIDCIHFCSL